jgi:hypothetical protein
MKMFHTTNTRNVPASHGRVRLVLAVVGIVTAVLCAMALLQDVRAAEPLDARAPRLLEISKIMASDLVGEVKIRLSRTLPKVIQYSVKFA